jgi:hypothetical protein
MDPLTGDELLARIKELSPDLSHRDMARECGYVSPVVPEDGSVPRVRVKAFLQAWLRATGEIQDTQRQRKLSYRTTVLAPGHAVIGRAYLERMGIEPGNQLSITVKRGAITLMPAEAAEDAEAEAA